MPDTCFRYEKETLSPVLCCIFSVVYICMLARRTSRVFVAPTVGATMFTQAVTTRSVRGVQVPKFIPNLNVAFFAGRAMARNESDPCVDPTTSLLHDGGAALPPEERERLDKLAAEGRHGATTGRLMDAHKVSR